MKFYMAEGWRTLLAHNRLDQFDAVWAVEIDPVDRPNVGHGGWSTVGRLALKRPGGGVVTVYLKRQENYKFRSLVFPLVRVASLDREMRRFFRLAKQGIPVSTPVYYEKRRIHGNTRAVLMIENLDGYRDLDRCLADLEKEGRPFLKKKRLIKAVAGVIRRLHETGFQHGMLFGKHIFIKGNADFSQIDVRLIDLEFARRHPNRVAKDLSRLYKRISRKAPGVPVHDYIRFAKDYMQADTVTPRVRRIVKKIQRRLSKTQRKRAAAATAAGDNNKAPAASAHHESVR